VTEAMTMTRFAVWFVPAGGLAFAASFMGGGAMSFWTQSLVFFLSASLFLLLHKTVLKGYLKKIRANGWAGRRAIVVETVGGSGEKGMVKAGGALLRAVSPEGALRQGEIVRIMEMRGSTAVCESYMNV